MFFKQNKVFSPFGNMALTALKGAVLGMLAGFALGIAIYYLQYILVLINQAFLNCPSGRDMYECYGYGPTMWPSVTIPSGLGSALGTLIGSILGGISGLKNNSK